MRDQFVLLYEKGVRRFYLGGALGVDMWAGEILLRLKEQPEYSKIELVLVLPFQGHDEQGDKQSRERLAFLIRHSMEHITIGETACRESYIKRNRFMVDHADYLFAVYDNDHNLRSGTMQTVNYAKSKRLPIILLHPDTAKIEYEHFPFCENRTIC